MENNIYYKNIKTEHLKQKRRRLRIDMIKAYNNQMTEDDICLVFNISSQTAKKLMKGV